MWSLRQAAETGPVTNLGWVTVRALALTERLCWAWYWRVIFIAGPPARRAVPSRAAGVALASRRQNRSATAHPNRLPAPGAEPTYSQAPGAARLIVFVGGADSAATGSRLAAGAADDGRAAAKVVTRQKPAGHQAALPGRTGPP